MGNTNLEEIIKVDLIRNILLILILLVLSRLILAGLSNFISRAFSNGDKTQDGYRKVRIETLTKTLYSVVRYVMAFIIIMIILDMLGVNTRSIIATAGIGGIAIAFGAQTLVKDIVTGMMIIFDDSFRVGDFIQAAGVTGTVENLGVRQTKIRDYDGSIHIIPNSEITNIKNFNDGPIRYECDIYLSYDVSVDQAVDIINSVRDEMKKEEDLKNYFIEDIRFLGINEIKESSYVARTTAVVVPGHQWEMARRTKRKIADEIYKRPINPSVQVVTLVNDKVIDEEV